MMHSIELTPDDIWIILAAENVQDAEAEASKWFNEMDLEPALNAADDCDGDMDAKLAAASELLRQDLQELGAFTMSFDTYRAQLAALESERALAQDLVDVEAGPNRPRL